MARFDFDLYCNFHAHDDVMKLASGDWHVISERQIAFRFMRAHLHIITPVTLLIGFCARLCWWDGDGARRAICRPPLKFCFLSQIHLKIQNFCQVHQKMAENLKLSWKFRIVGKFSKMCQKCGKLTLKFINIAKFTRKSQNSLENYRNFQKIDFFSNDLNRATFSCCTFARMQYKLARVQLAWFNPILGIFGRGILFNFFFFL